MVVNVTALTVYWSLISNPWNPNRDNAVPSRYSWTARYWRSCINKLNILNHFSILAIIGQIKPWGFLKSRTTSFIKCMKWVLLSSRGLIELGEVGVCSYMICDIGERSENHSSMLIVIFAIVSTLVLTLENHIPMTQKILWNSKAMPYFRETAISFFFWVCGYIKLYKLNEGDLVLGDVCLFRYSTNVIFITDTNSQALHL